MAKEEVSKKVIVDRLKKIEGQARGLQKMVEDGRECESILTQLAAVRSAIEGVGALVLNNYMKLCFPKTDENRAEEIDSLARALAIWGRVHIGE